MFELNDNLVCINDKPLEGSANSIDNALKPEEILGPDVVVGENYKAGKIHICGCGKQHIDVGLPLKIGFVSCFDCGEKLPSITHWCHPSRFKKA
jgi:hypothetical protein